MCKPCRNGNEGWVLESVSRCRWCAATATFLLAVHLRSVCKGEGGEIEGLVPIILRAGLYVGFLWGCALLIVPEPASSVIPTLACTRGPGALKPSSSGLSQILISEYALSWTACTNKTLEPGVEPRPPEPGGHTGQAHYSEWLMPLRHQGRHNFYHFRDNFSRHSKKINYHYILVYKLICI